MVGLCYMDYDFFLWGKFIVMGYEGVGEIIELGEVVWVFEVGDKVIFNWVIFCMSCF